MRHGRFSGGVVTLFLVLMLLLTANVYAVETERRHRTHKKGFFSGLTSAVSSAVSKAVSATASILSKPENKAAMSKKKEPYTGPPEIEPLRMGDKEYSSEEVLDMYLPEYISSDKDNPHTNDWGCCRLCEDTSEVTKVQIDLHLAENHDIKCCPVCPFSPKTKVFDVLMYYQYLKGKSSVYETSAENYEKDLRKLFVGNPEEASFIQKDDTTTSDDTTSSDVTWDETKPEPLDLDKTFPMPKYFKATRPPCCSVCKQSSMTSDCCAYCTRDVANQKTYHQKKETTSRSNGVAPPK